MGVYFCDNKEKNFPISLLHKKEIEREAFYFGTRRNFLF